MAIQSETHSLLLFRVGPVLCCAPSLPVSSIILPPTLTHPPGSNMAQPGIFKHGGHIISSLDLRYKFGVEQSEWVTPGRMIIAHLHKVSIGFWVDEILEVIEQPASGWGPLPSLLPRGIFTRTLLRDNGIYLYAELDALRKIPSQDYLRVYIQQLVEEQQRHLTTQACKTAALSVTPSDHLRDLAGTASTHPSTTATDKIVSNSGQQNNRVEASIQNHIQPGTTSASASSDKKQTTLSGIRKVHHANTTVSHADHRGKPIRNTAKPTAIEAMAKKTSHPLTSAINHGTSQAKPQTGLSHNTLKKNPPVHTAFAKHNNKSPDTNTALPLTGKVTRPKTQRVTQNNGLVRMFSFILLTLLGATAWLLWPASQPESIDVAAHQSIVNAPPAPATTRTLPDADSAALPVIDEHIDATVEHHTIITEHVASVNPSSLPATTREMTAPIEDAQNKDVGTTTAATIAGTIKDNTVSLADEVIDREQNKAQPATTQVTSSTLITTFGYSASIEKDPHGMTIVIDAPENEDVFKTDEENPQVPPAQSADSSEQTVSLPITPEASPPATPHPTTNRPASKTEVVHIVVKGDTLWHIASRYLNNPYLYPELAKLSNIQNPDLIYPGNRVRIVKRSKKIDNSSTN